MSHIKPGSCQSLPVCLFLVLDHCCPVCLTTVKMALAECFQLNLKVTPVLKRQLHAASITNPLAGDSSLVVIALIEWAADIKGIPASCHASTLLHLQQIHSKSTFYSLSSAQHSRIMDLTSPAPDARRPITHGGHIFDSSTNSASAFFLLLHCFRMLRQEKLSCIIP